ncbi:MAG: hypothetical protein AAGE52_05140 [Myxococcota bacterium]
MRSALSFALLLLAACSSSGTSRPEPIEEFPADPLDAIDPTADPGCTASWIIGGRGRIVDERGEPIESARPQLCLRLVGNELLCLLPPESETDGFWHQEIETDARCIQDVALRTLLPGSTFGTTYCEVPLTLNSGVLEMRDPIILYDLVPATAPPLGDENAAREVVFDDGLVLEVTPSVFFSDEYENLVGRRVDLDDPPCFVEEGSLLGLYAFGPEASILNDSDEGFPIRIPNTEGLADGTVVELLILGGLETRLPGERLIEEAEFEVYGTAVVRGEEIVSNPDGALPYLSWLGYRVAE